MTNLFVLMNAPELEYFYQWLIIKKTKSDYKIDSVDA